VLTDQARVLWSGFAWDAAPVQTSLLARGTHALAFPFTKPFVPYACRGELLVATGAVRVCSWLVKPDAEVLLPALQQWAAGGPAPEWLRDYGDADPAARWSPPPPVRFGGRLALRRVSLPAEVAAGMPLTLCLGLTREGPAWRRIAEYAVFLHLMDRDGSQVLALRLDLSRALTGARLTVPLRVRDSEAVPEGEYDVYVGVYHPRTEVRLPVAGDSLSAFERRTRRVRLGRIRVCASASAAANPVDQVPRRE
jgi:hypothetical protein